MALNKHKLGDLIELCDETNFDLKYTVDDVKGISIKKVFIKTKADMQGVSLKPYLLVRPDDFAYVTVTSRNGEKITLAHNDTNNTYIVSSSYVVFKVKRTDLLNSYYLFMYFNRQEFDRYSRFNSWGSARETFSYDDLCDIEIELPDLDTQQKFVNIYLSMLENQKNYERGLDDLKLVCDGYIEDLRRKHPCEKIGKYICETRVKNDKELPLRNRSVSNKKVFIDAKEAVVSGVDTKNYLIVEKNEFAYNTVTTRNDNKLSIALNADERCLVSPLYTTFKVISKKILPEYLNLRFSRLEYDRLSRFSSWGSARELFNYDTLESCTNVPIPPIEIQQSIVNIYHVLNERKQINEQLKEQIKNICPILIKGSIEEAKEA